MTEPETELLTVLHLQVLTGAQFTRLPNLSSLEVSGCAKLRVSSAAFRGSGELQQLSLAGNSLSSLHQVLLLLHLLLLSLSSQPIHAVLVLCYSLFCTVGI